MDKICNTELCTGCAACSNICAKNAVSLLPDERGFLRPLIDQYLCVDCGLCKTVCPQVKRLKPTNDGKVYAALAINDELREQSSSGGVFSLLAEHVLRAGGVVFGATMDESLCVKHVMVDSIQNLDKLRGSKYVQSEIGVCYSHAKQVLENGKEVLFSGTPCQIDALNHVLGKRYDKLLLVDILCHGVPSPAVFSKFIKSREVANGKKVLSVNFRDKDPGWTSFSTSLHFDDGSIEIDNSFYYFFVKNYCLRDSCYSCLYSSTKRVGDITLGDYWGYQESAPEHIEDDDRGISLVLVNTGKGEKALRAIRGKIEIASRAIEDAVNGNQILSHPFTPNPDSARFWDGFFMLSWDELVEKYSIPREKKKDWISVEDRLYYSKPFKSRHFRHLLHCAKVDLYKKMGRR